MRQLVRRLIQDDRGYTLPMGLVLVTSIVALGAITGLVTVRDHLVQQFGDVAVALNQLRQSYNYTVIIDADPTDIVLTGDFSDDVDLSDESEKPPAGLDLAISPIDEGLTED